MGKTAERECVMCVSGVVWRLGAKVVAQLSLRLSLRVDAMIGVATRRIVLGPTLTAAQVAMKRRVGAQDEGRRGKEGGP